MLMTCTFIFPALTSPLNSDSSIQLSASLSFPSECLLGILNVQWPDRKFCDNGQTEDFVTHQNTYSPSQENHTNIYLVTQSQICGHYLSPLLIFSYIQSLNKNSKLDFQSKSPFCPLLPFPLYDLVQATIVTFLDYDKLLPVSLPESFVLFNPSFPHCSSTAFYRLR